VHRDVKPSNIVIDEGNRPMLLDFGIVLELGEPSLTSEGMLVGTPHYMAPEQIFSPTSVDGRADLYAVGVLMFEVLTGKLPYQGNTPQALMKNHLTAEPPDPKTLAPHLTPRSTRMVQRALIKDPDQRYQNADEMLADLRGELARAAVDEESSEPGSSPGLPKDQLVYAIAGAALLAIAAFVIVMPMMEEKPQPIFAEVKARPLPPPPPVVTPVVPIAPPPPDPIEVKEEPVKPAPKRTPVKTVKPAPKPEVILAMVPSRDPEVKEAQALLRKGDTRSAIKKLDAAVAKNPRSPEPYPTLGDAYALTGNKNGAIAAYRRYLVLSPQGAGAKQVEAALDRLGGR
jgi:serine/threonine-protein kinase